MATTKRWKWSAKGCAAALLFALCMGIAPSAWAVYEIDQDVITANTELNTRLKNSDNLTIQWTAPTMSGGYVLGGYIYKWTNTSLPLDGEAFNAAVGLDGTIGTEVIPPSLVRTDLADLDGDTLYLHIKTLYQEPPNLVEYSDDVVYGPFLIDNVAPTGTIQIVDANGNETAWTTTTTVNVKLAASQDTAKAYLNESESTLTSQHIDPYTVDAEYSFANISAGEKTIYAWFEDGVGNISTPVAATVTLASKYISPGSVTIYLPSGSEQVTQSFQVEGTTESYHWTITNETPENSGETVASIAGSPGNSITVTPLHKGTFQLHAVPDGGATAENPALDSGTITVAQSYTLGDVNNDGTIDSGDAILILRYSVGLVTLTSVQIAAGEVTGDTTLDSGDAIKILRYSVGLISSL